MPGKVFVGQSVQRLEDPDLLRGRGQFLDDLALPGMLEAAFVRSPFAHTSFGRIDTAAAAAMPGVVAVLTAADLPAEMREKRILLQVPHPAITYPVTQMPLASHEVCFVGEAVAMVFAETLDQARDAAALGAPELGSDGPLLWELLQTAAAVLLARGPPTEDVSLLAAR